MFFKLLRGSHAVKTGDKSQIHHVKGDEIESDIDLVEKFGSEKFSRVYEEERRPKRKRKLKKKTPSEEEVNDGDQDDDGSGGGDN